MSNSLSYDNRRERAGKKRRRRNRFFAACVAALILFIIGMVLLCHSCALSKPVASSDSRLVGRYILSDGSCTYVFHEDGSGYLQLTGGSQYHFTFSLSDKTLKIDFESTSISDSTYTVIFNDNGLTLTAGKDTIAPGREYVLNQTL